MPGSRARLLYSTNAPDGDGGSVVVVVVVVVGVRTHVAGPAAGVTVTGVDIGELDSTLTTGPRHGRDTPQATARIEFTAAGTAEPRQMTVRIGYALAMAAATGAPVRVADQLMDRLAVSAHGDLANQFTRDVPLPRRRRGWPRLFRGHPQARLAAR